MSEDPTSESSGDPTDPIEVDDDGPSGTPGVSPPEEPLDPGEISDLEHQDETSGLASELEEEELDLEEFDLGEERDPGLAADLDDDPGPMGNAQDPVDEEK